MTLFTSLRPTHKGMFIALCAFALLCFGDACIKKASLDHDIVYAALFTNLFSIAIVIAISFFVGGPRKLIISGTPKIQLLRGLIMLGVYLSFLYAITNMPIAETYTLAFTQPFFLVLLAHLLKLEKIGPHRLIAIAIGFLGVLLAVRPGFEAITSANLVALLAAFLFACANISVKFIDKSDHWLTYIFYIMLVQTPVLAIILLYQQDFSIDLPTISSLPWFAGAGASYALGVPLLAIALKNIDASAVGAIQYTGLIWGSLLGFIIFSEIPTLWTASGALVIVASGLYLVYREQIHSSEDKI